ncbi:hypothetical protein HPB47_018695 [Ixodes persulcatus]|uniref:Uncharacterized protein n=1 Tax=Ixodes persulcatus TaxID=34615 RepID=A0AC60QK17_IXOPE|nr:hypothetical protein HPB47_018695 [Ixodes persulcatus]
MEKKELGIQNQLYEELLESDSVEYRRLLRVPHDIFVELLARVRPRIQRQTTNMRRPVSAKTRLQLTLRYLASGESHHHSLSRQFRVGHSAVNDIIHSTCAVIYDMLKDEELAAPKSTDAWLRAAQQFSDRWQFPNCVGGNDGKHVAIIKPAKSGTVYYNYKKTYSILLFALADASCKFLYVDVGTPGSKGDAAIWQTTPLQKAVRNKSSGLPDLVDMNTSSGLQLPAVIVGDDAFPLSSNLMKPFGGSSLTPEQKIFNYRDIRTKWNNPGQAKRLEKSQLSSACGRRKIAPEPLL